MLTVIGLMSGTSLDGIDAAILKTDGKKIINPQQNLALNYDDKFRSRIKEVISGKGDFLALERDLTIKHADAVKKLLKKYNVKADLIGFHGQTIIHRPKEGITWQMGNGALLAELTGIDVICDLRRRDVAAGGQGAPLVPLYHAGILHKEKKPVVILNIGGVSNVTYIDNSAEKIIACDTGPGNALLNDWIYKHTGKEFDAGGKISSKGKADEKIISRVLADEFFNVKKPKSLDRNHFKKISNVENLSLENGAATLSEITVRSILKACRFFPKHPAKWFVAGGGRHNNYFMQRLDAVLPGEVYNIDILKMNGDFIEAEAFAFLAARAKNGLHLSLPTTTGVKKLVPGGAFYQA